jgi:transposase
MQLKFEAEKIWIASQPVDFRKAVDGLCAVILEQMQEQPRDGLFVFYNKARNRLKLIGWHGNGFIMVYKRLERGHFKIQIGERISVTTQQLDWLLAGLDWQLLRDWNEAKTLEIF